MAAKVLLCALLVAAAACSARDGAGSQGTGGASGQSGSSGAGTGGGAGSSGSGGSGGIQVNTGGTGAVGNGDGGTSVVPFAPREEFCAHAPGSGIAVPDPRVVPSQSSAPNAPDLEQVCTGDLAKRTFRFGLCSCQDIEASGTLSTNSFNSSTGMLGQDGSVGVRTRMTATTFFDIQGSLWVAGLDSAQQPTLEVNGSNVVAGELRVGGNVDGSSFLNVGHDAYVAGDLAQGVLGTVTGKLHQPAGASPGVTNAAGGVRQEPVTVADPCNCDKPLDIANIVQRFATQNDNAASGVAHDALIAPTGTNLTLECGRYYFDGVNLGGASTLHLTGRTAIFVQGDFNVLSLFTVQLDPGAELDLFITGNVRLEGVSDFGSKNAPARIRMYVGGTDFTLVSLATLGANVYARSATVTANGTLSVWGSLYADRIALTTLADFHYDSAILDTPGCEPPGQTCEDCQGCSGASCVAGQCAPCTTGADCCAPLVCSQGECVLLSAPE